MTHVVRSIRRHKQALAADQEDVAIGRRLALADPAGREPGLAQAVYNLAVDLHKLARHDDARPQGEEVAAILRRLARKDPVSHQGEPADTLYNFAFDLGKLGRHDEALAVGLQAVEIRVSSTLRTHERM